MIAGNVGFTNPVIHVFTCCHTDIACPQRGSNPRPWIKSPALNQLSYRGILFLYLYSIRTFLFCQTVSGFLCIFFFTILLYSLLSGGFFFFVYLMNITIYHVLPHSKSACLFMTKCYVPVFAF